MDQTDKLNAIAAQVESRIAKLAELETRVAKLETTVMTEDRVKQIVTNVVTAYDTKRKQGRI